MPLIERIKDFGFGSIAYLYLLTFMLTIMGCRGENKIYEIDKRSDLGISLVEHLYVFEEEGFEVNALFVHKDINTNKYILNLYLKGNISTFAKDHRAFVHGFKKLSDTDKSINIVLNNPEAKGDSLVFRKALTLGKDSLFEKVNFGVENKITKKRKFVLTLKNVDLQELP